MSSKSLFVQIKSMVDKILRQDGTKKTKPDEQATPTSTSTSAFAPTPAPPCTSQTTKPAMESVPTPPDPNQSEPPQIAILGAGIAGLALSIALSKLELEKSSSESRPIHFTLYESAPSFSAVGAGIGLGPNSLSAIDLIDARFRAAYDAVKTANERPEFQDSVFDALYAEPGFGTARGWGVGSRWGEGRVGAAYFERSSAHRRDLLGLMEAFVGEGRVRFGKRAVEIMDLGEKVRVQFDDGTEILVDALIGADGIRGISRKTVLGDDWPDCVSPKYCGMYIYRGIIPMPACKRILGPHGGDAKWFMARGRGLAIYPISKGAEENFVFFVADESQEWPAGASGSHIDCAKEDMLKDLQGFDERLLELLDWAKPLKWPIFHHPHTPTFYKGRVCMMGDVAHATSPHQAAGAGQGLEDAVVLAHLLGLVRSREELETAFGVYDRVRRSRAEEVVRTSEEAGRMYLWMSELGEDMGRIVENANGRLHWIWKHDLRREREEVGREFWRRVGRGGE